MDGIRKIDRCRTLGQTHNIALRGKHEYLVLEQVDFQRAEELVKIVRILFGFEQRAYPLQLLVGEIMPYSAI